MAQEKKLNLYQKLVEVRKAVPNLPRDKQGYQYKYTKPSTVLLPVVEKMNGLGVLLVTEVTSVKDLIIDEYTTEDKNGKEKKNRDKIIQGEMLFTFINAENPDERLPVQFHLFGVQDDISKAFGSGLTYCERYFLLKFFNIADDAADPDARQGQPDKKSEHKPPQTDKNPSGSTKPMTKAQQQGIARRRDALKWDNDILEKKIVSLFGKIIAPEGEPIRRYLSSPQASKLIETMEAIQEERKDEGIKKFIPKDKETGGLFKPDKDDDMPF